MKVNNHFSTSYTLTFTACEHNNCEWFKYNNYKDLYWHLISHLIYYNTQYHMCNTLCMYVVVGYELVHIL